MNTLRLLLILGIAAAAGCDTKDKCVADCEANDDSVDEPTSDESGSGSGSISNSETGAGACEDAMADAQAFIVANRECQTHEDCKFVDGICYQDAESECGSVAVANTADEAQWDVLHGALESTCNECGANACGATAVCTDEGFCEAQFGTMEVQCILAEQEVDAFLADNRACEVDTDCQYVDKGCYDGPLAECVAVSLNVDADLEIWHELEQALGPCGHECWGNECGASPRCGADGLCEAFF